MTENEITMKEIAELVRDGGILERRVPQGGWRAPSVVILDKSEKWLLWGALKEGHPWTTVKYPKEGMLEEFIGLADAEPKEILRYARKWGVLMRCKHGRPFALEVVGLEKETCKKCHLLFMEFVESRDSIPPPTESLSLWRRYSQEIGAILRIAGNLHRGENASDKDWDFILKPYRKLGYSLSKRSYDLGWIIQDWSQKANLKIVFEWNIHQDPLLILGGGLLPNLALQMILAITRTDSMVLCSSCGQPYIPKRAPNPNRRHYCSNCGINAAWRTAQRDRRLKARKLISP